MNHTRSLAAALMVALLSGATLSQVPDRAEADRPNPKRPEPLVAPQDPAQVKGSWLGGGTRQTITAGEFHSAHVLLQKMEGSSQRAVTEEEVWEYVLAAAEAEDFGLAVTQGELDAILERNDPDIFEGTLARWESQGISVEEGIEYTRRNAAIGKLRDFFANTSRITTRDAFDLFKTAHLLYKVEYLKFAAEDFAKEIEAQGLDEDTLRTFWNENRAVPQRFRTPNEVSAEFIYLDPAQMDADDVAALGGNRKIDRQEAIDYFHANRAALLAQVPPSQQHLLHFDGTTPLEQVKSPFELLEDTIKKTLVLDRVLQKAYAEAKEGKPDFKAIADKHHLAYLKVENCDRAASLTELRSFGFNVFANLFNTEPGAIAPEIQSQQQVRYFFRLNDRKDSVVPEFDDVKDEVRKVYLEMQGTDRARGAAREILDALGAKVQEDLGNLEERLLVEANEEANRRIEELGLTRPADQNRERLRSRGQVRQKIEEAKRAAMPKHYRAWVEATHPKLQVTDYFEFQNVRNDAAMQGGGPRGAEEFLKTNFYIRSLNPGEVAPVMLEDHVEKAFYIAALVDRKDPPLEMMGPVDLMQARAQLAQVREHELARQFRYPGLRERLDLQLSKSAGTPR
ncbi:MAG: hypothetical protein KDB53_13010 [Planctomycetes bacterium]|nr:hypothetical protein [Planctomycetota bacterium]